MLTLSLRQRDRRAVLREQKMGCFHPDKEQENSIPLHTGSGDYVGCWYSLHSQRFEKPTLFCPVRALRSAFRLRTGSSD